MSFNPYTVDARAMKRLSVVMAGALLLSSCGDKNVERPALDGNQAATLVNQSFLVPPTPSGCVPVEGISQDEDARVVAVRSLDSSGESRMRGLERLGLLHVEPVTDRGTQYYRNTLTYKAYQLFFNPLKQGADFENLCYNGLQVAGVPQVFDLQGQPDIKVVRYWAFPANWPEEMLLAENEVVLSTPYPVSLVAQASWDAQNNRWVVTDNGVDGESELMTALEQAGGAEQLFGVQPRWYDTASASAAATTLPGDTAAPSVPDPDVVAPAGQDAPAVQP